MKQDNDDVVLRVTTEWDEFTARMNYDIDSTSMIRNFANILRSMTFVTSSIIDSLREVADDLEEDARLVDRDNDINNSEDYGTAN